MSNFRHALRSLGNAPGFTATAIATLALCLGANLAIFAVVDAVLVRALPFRESERLVTIFNSYPTAGVDRAGASTANYFDRRAAIKAFSSISLQQDGELTVGGKGSPDRVATGRVTPEFFSTLGVSLAMGQPFTDANLIYGTDEVAILTDGYWRSQFAADPNVIGRTFLNDGIPVRVIGVLPPNFRYLSSKAQFYRPASHFPADRLNKARHNNNWSMIGRLAPGVTLTQAQAEIDAFNLQQAADDPFAEMVKGAKYHTVVASLHGDHVSNVRPILLLLECAVLFLLLIGSVNLANLLLIRASGRTKELAVRQALGAGRLDIAREVLVETMLLSAAGGILGLIIGAFGIQLLSTLGTDQLPLGATVQFDGRVAVFGLGAVLALGLALAAPIIWFNLSNRLTTGLQAETRGGTTSRAAQRLRHAFIVAQVSLAFVLLSGAGLLGISLKHVLETPPGFRAETILTGEISMPWINYKDDKPRIAFLERLLPALRVLPGVTHAAVNNTLPFSDNNNDSAVIVEGYTPGPGEGVRAHYLSFVAGEYWSAMGIPLIRGRFLDDADQQRKERVCVVDQALADRYWPDGQAIGHRLAFGGTFSEENAYTVVGVVGQVKQRELAENAGHGAAYFPYAKGASPQFSLVVSTNLSPVAIAPMVQKAVLEIDHELPVNRLRPMQQRIDDTLVTRRSPAILAAIFAGVALLLAAIGTYGVLAYAVSQRRREIGVRMALGAHPRQITNQFLGLGLRLLAVGSVLGVAGAWLAGRAMQGVLYSVPSTHPITLLGTTIVLSFVTFISCLLPARRAARVDPMTALRAE